MPVEETSAAAAVGLEYRTTQVEELQVGELEPLVSHKKKVLLVTNGYAVVLIQVLEES